MLIQIINIKQGFESTLSLLAIDKKSTCNVLQDEDRGLTSDMPLCDILKKKVFGRTAIPTGRYRVQLTESARFGRVMPELLNVPGFGGIRIHSGNYVSDTEGCLLVGTAPDQDAKGYYRVWSSRDTFARLFAQMQAAVARKEEIWCEVSRHYPTN